MANFIDKDKLIRELKDYYCIFPAMVKRAIENAPVITIDEDYAIQCTCYALGCQQAEQIETKAKQEVAKRIFEEIESNYDKYSYFGLKTFLAELKKKYVGE